MSAVIHAITSVPPLLAYLLVALLAFGESAAFVGFVLPGETALLFGGLVAAQGKVSLPIMIAVGICAAVGGDSVGYQIGRRFGVVACYGHGQAQLVQVGDHVAAGQPVALEGCQGDCSGPHLHFEIPAGLWGPVQDPAPFMAAHGVKLG